MQADPPNADRSPRAVLDEVNRLITRSVAGNLEFVRRMSALARQTARQFQQDPPQPTATGGGRLLRTLVDLNLEFYSALTDHGLAFLNDLADAAERQAGVPPRTATGQGGSPGVAATGPAAGRLVLAARVGERAAAAFVVENSFPRRLDAACEAAPIVGRLGRVDARIAFDPADLSIPPGGSQVVRVAVDVTPAFTPGETYTSQVGVVGLVGQEIGIVLKVEPEPTDTPAATNSVQAPPSTQPPPPMSPAMPDAADALPASPPPAAPAPSKPSRRGDLGTRPKGGGRRKGRE